MGRGKRCGMGRFAGRFYSGLAEERFGRQKNFSYEIHLTDSEASLGAKKEILLNTSRQTKRVLINIPPKVKDGVVIRLIGESRLGITEEVFLRVKIVKKKGQLITWLKQFKVIREIQKVVYAMRGL